MARTKDDLKKETEDHVKKTDDLAAMTSSLELEEKNHGETKANLAKTKDNYKKEIENHLKKSV